MPKVVIDPRFNGFPEIALGGYVGGILARGRPKCEVNLCRPVKTGKSYEVITSSEGTSLLREGGEVLAYTHDTSIDIKPQQFVGFEESTNASKSYPGYRKHLVATCFNCGPLRKEGDGLRIFPGIVGGGELVAAPWIPDKSLGNPNGEVDRSSSGRHSTVLRFGHLSLGAKQILKIEASR